MAAATRAAYRRELIPVRLRWWLAASGMCDWLRVLRRDLRQHLGQQTEPVLIHVITRLFERRGEVLRGPVPALAQDRRALGLLMAALYRMGRLWRLGQAPRGAWILAGLGGPPRGAGEWARAQALLLRLPPQRRWEEVATHLGELLIVLTEELPPHLLHSRRILGDICFTAGARYAQKVCQVFGIDPQRDSGPAQAIEVLRMSEYIFHVNPEHWSETSATTGWLEGTACPWYSRPGWNGAHCGIFGQFQAGISSVFGLRYHLARTIPKHGGSTCRIDLKPIQISTRPPRPLEEGPRQR